MKENFKIGQVIYKFEIDYSDFSYEILECRIKNILENRPDYIPLTKYSLEILNDNIYVDYSVMSLCNTKIDSFVGSWLYPDIQICKNRLREYLSEHVSYYKSDLKKLTNKKKNLKKEIDNITINTHNLQKSLDSLI